MKRIWTTMILLTFIAIAGCSESGDQAVFVSVGDPAEEAWQKLKEQGHEIAKIPLDGRIEQMTPTPDGGHQGQVVAMTVPYDINGRVVLFTHEYADNTISAISIDGGTKAVESIELPRASKQ